MKKITSPKNLAPQVRLTLDWRAYYHEFCRIHGEPIPYQGRHLFRDGWIYSSTDYRGPEWEPPKDKDSLAKLVTIYYKVRLAFLRREHRTISEMVDGLDQLQRMKSVPLQHKIVVTDDEGNRILVRQPVPLVEYKRRLEWLDNDIEECLTKITEAKNATESKANV